MTDNDDNIFATRPHDAGQLTPADWAIRDRAAAITDRVVSRRSALFGGVAALSIPLLAACGSSSSSSASKAPSAGASAVNGTASKGGTMRIARPPASNAETLDPASSLSAYEYLGALYNRLVKQAPDGSATADLATNWTASADSSTFTFTLRSDVTFHDGKAFTSADAAYTLGHILDPATKSPQAGVLSPFLTKSGITTPDKNTLVVKLEAPNAEFVSLLMNYNCYVIPDGSAATIGKTGIGTGPFSLVSFVAAGKGTVKANPNYFGGKPNLDSIEFSAIADVQARVNALLAGQVDLIAQTNLDYATSKTVTASSIATTATVKNAEWYVMPMLCTAAPFTNVAVRQALKIAYDPADLLSLALHGRGTIANNNPVVPTDASYLDYKVAFDPDKAKSMLKTAGVSTQDLYTSSYDPVFTPLSEAYQSSVAAAGLKVNIQTASADSYYTDIWIKKPFCVSYWYTGRPIDQLLNQIFRSGSGYNETLWSDPSFASVLDSARRSADPAKRKQYYQDAQKLLVDNSGSIVPFFADRITGLSKKVVNYSEYGFEFDYVHIGFAS
jgi:peptide/nickel transport system substrate-binding protein